MFTACGDEVTEVTQVNESAGIEVLAAGDTLGYCTKDNAGEMLFVTDSSAVYYCADGKWQTLNGADGKDGDNGQKGDGCSIDDKGNGVVEITCGEGDGVYNYWDGKDDGFSVRCLKD